MIDNLKSESLHNASYRGLPVIGLWTAARVQTEKKKNYFPEKKKERGRVEVGFGSHARSRIYTTPTAPIQPLEIEEDVFNYFYRYNPFHTILSKSPARGRLA